MGWFFIFADPWMAYIDAKRRAIFHTWSIRVSRWSSYINPEIPSSKPTKIVMNNSTPFSTILLRKKISEIGSQQYYTPEDQHITWKWWEMISFSRGVFSGSMVSFQGRILHHACHIPRKTSPNRDLERNLFLEWNLFQKKMKRGRDKNPNFICQGTMNLGFFIRIITTICKAYESIL